MESQILIVLLVLTALVGYGQSQFGLLPPLPTTGIKIIIDNIVF